MLSKLRAQLHSFVNIVAYPFAGMRINPNIFSICAVPLAILSAYLIVRQDFYNAFILALLAVSVDLFDGAVARLQNRETLFGNYFETMVDKMVEIILFIGCAFLYPIASVCALGFSMLASYAKPRAALVIITDNRDWPAVGEHSERMLLLLAGLLLSFFGFSFAGYRALELCLWAIALLALIGSWQRIFYAKKLIAEAERKGEALPYLKKKPLKN